MEKQQKLLKKTTIGDLCEEVLEVILSRVPFKARTRMKCVSKDWRRLILPLPRVSALGLILLESYGYFDQGEGEDEALELLMKLVFDMKYKTLINLFDLKDQGGELECFEHNALDNNLDVSVSYVCYSNGMLLCCEKDFSRTSFIYNMLLKEPVVMLPPVDEFLIYHPNIGIGLSYNGLPNRHYKVVCFFCDIQGKKFVGRKGYMHYKIYSSETGEWRKDRAKFLNSSILYNTNIREAWYNAYREASLPKQLLFHEGLIYWAFFDYLIVYNLHENFFDIQEFPRKDEETETCPFDECLWMSEECLHYCYCDKEGFYVWTRVKGEEIHYDWWKLKNRVNFETLKNQHPEFFHKVEDKDIRFLNPCAFNEDLQILYFKLPNNLVVSYSFELRCLRKVRQLNH